MVMGLRGTRSRKGQIWVLEEGDRFVFFWKHGSLPHPTLIGTFG
jgi:hypothetical protein